MIRLEPDRTYHIFNRANGNEKIFTQERNYKYFLNQYRKYIVSIADTFCYCLMPNHFHFLLRIKEKEKLMMLPDFPKFRTLENLISKRFSHYFSSYTQAFNKQEKRKGSLFIKNFKRSPVTDKKYLQKLVHYIHYNPVEAGLASKPQEWKYSSYNAILSSRPTLVLKEEVIEWFGDLENFIYCHKFPPKETGIEKF